MVTLPEISEVLSAHPAVRRAETAMVRHDGRDVAIAAAELSEYASGPILRNHVRRELGEDSGLAGVVIVERMPMAWQVRCTSIQSFTDDFSRLMRFRTSSSRISAPPPGRESRPASRRRHKVSCSDKPLTLAILTISGAEKQ